MRTEPKPVVIRFPLERRIRSLGEPAPDEPAEVVVLPVVRVERHELPPRSLLA